MPAYEMHPLAFDFFQKFARFEYALKATGRTCYLDVDPNGRVMAAWDKFAGTDPIRSLMGAVEASPVMKIIVGQPPKRRIEVGGMLDWSVAPPRPKTWSKCVLCCDEFGITYSTATKDKSGPSANKHFLMLALQCWTYYLRPTAWLPTYSTRHRAAPRTVKTKASAKRDLVVATLLPAPLGSAILSVTPAHCRRASSVCMRKPFRKRKKQVGVFLVWIGPRKGTPPLVGAAH